ncbi:MAG: hypothetical protein JO189_02960 [Deltaproteobacteria bacterium]|nr:hypothetical protein [Deltaproteobacteria bacterium]
MSLRQDFSRLKETIAGRRQASQRKADWRQHARTFAFRATTAGLGLAALFFPAAKTGGQQQRPRIPFSMSVNGGKGRVNGTLVCYETPGYWSASGMLTDTSPPNDRSSSRYHFSPSIEFEAWGQPLPEPSQERKVDISLIFHGPLYTKISLSLEKVRAITGYDFTGLKPDFDKQAMRNCADAWSSPQEPSAKSVTPPYVPSPAGN